VTRPRRNARYGGKDRRAALRAPIPRVRQLRGEAKLSSHDSPLEEDGFETSVPSGDGSPLLDRKTLPV